MGQYWDCRCTLSALTSRLGVCRCCLDRGLFNVLSRTDVSHMALKRKTSTESQGVIGNPSEENTGYENPVKSSNTFIQRHLKRGDRQTRTLWSWQHLPPRFARVVKESPGTSTLPISSELGQRMHHSCTNICYIGLQS